MLSGVGMEQAELGRLLRVHKNTESAFNVVFLNKAICTAFVVFFLIESYIGLIWETGENKRITEFTVYIYLRLI